MQNSSDSLILIVDDDRLIRSSISFILKRNGYRAMSAESPAEALTLIRKEMPRLVLLDMNFSLSTTGDEGLVFLKQLKLFYPHLPVILMTAWGSIPLAVQGMQAGAFDFMTKPWDNGTLLERIDTALHLNEPEGQGEKADFDRSFIIGKSRALTAVLDTVRRVAATQASVLLTGESGTGKELIAEAIHRGSRRAQAPFVKVNLGGISQSLFESEMFGHKKGAFTDAFADRTGRFEMAEGGTIFLDEIGELDPSCQVKLLRVLQDQTYEVLGDSRPRRANVRVVSATNADLPAMVKERSFREDLFYRINLIQIKLPPLRERREDIPLLVNHFVQKLAVSQGLTIPEVSADAMELLSKLPYSGNIRELKNLVERAVLLADSSRLEASGFAPFIPDAGAALLSSEATLEEMECTRIRAGLDRYDGNLSQLARELGITRQALYRRMEKYGLK